MASSETYEYSNDAFDLLDESEMLFLKQHYLK